MTFLRKYHKWISIIFSFFIILFAISGIILNHRELLSRADVNRNLLPKSYSYQNWNNAAVNSTLKINSDSILLYGNIGIWLTDSIFSNFNSFNNGFGKGVDNRKISKLLYTKNKKLLAGTFFGLFEFDFKNSAWRKIKIPIHEKRITDIIQVNDSILILSRSFLLKTKNLNTFTVTELPENENYDNKIGLFKTLWVIHSGEIYGLPGKIIVDIIGLIFTFLTITGFIIFFNKIILKKPISDKKKHNLKMQNRWNLKWHNKIGWTTTILLIITTLTGMFLRPPLLIAIAEARVSKIAYNELDSPNPWFDKLRRILYDSEKNRFLVSTLEGIFYSDDNFQSKLKQFPYQPPISVMGITVFQKTAENTYLIGSFEGLFEWNSETGFIWDKIMNRPYYAPKRKGPPIGQFLVSGYTSDYKNTEIIFDYNQGALNILGQQEFTQMPKQIQSQPISLWNVALELHTGRIFEPLMGIFYILVVPISGFAILFILISGFILWWKNRKQKN